MGAVLFELGTWEAASRMSGRLHHSATAARETNMEDENFLRRVTLFTEFEPDELHALRKSMISTRFGPGDVILEEGNANRALHILKSGRIRVTRHVQDKGDVSLCDLIEGQTFGELSIIEDGVASASLRAVTESEIFS